MISRARYTRRLARLVRTPTVELQALEKLWPKVRGDFARNRRALLAAIPKDDPIRLSLDLLSSIKRPLEETLHTQALAYAFDPGSPHGFGKQVLVSVVETIARLRPRSGAARVLRRLKKEGATVQVRPEYRYRIEGYRDRSVARSDIWIEIRVRRASALIVIENKIGASESSGQLAWYERKVRKWCRSEGHSACLLIFLTTEGRPGRTSKARPWTSLSYLEVAAGLRAAWKRMPDTPARSWLGLYIASITRGVLGVQPEQWDSVSLADIETYLQTS